MRPLQLYISMAPQVKAFNPLLFQAVRAPSVLVAVMLAIVTVCMSCRTEGRGRDKGGKRDG